MQYLKEYFERIEKGQSGGPGILLKDILEILEEEGVGMGRNPYRTFVYYQEMGLIPKSKDRTSRREIAFPPMVPFLIKSIREALQAGYRLSEIKVGLELSRLARDDVIKKMLNIDANCKKALVNGLLGGIRGSIQFYICFLCPNALKIIKVKSTNPANYFTVEDDLHVEVVKTFTLEEYGEAVKTVAIEEARRIGEVPQLQTIMYNLYPPLKEINPSLYDKYGPSFLEHCKGGFVRKRTPRKGVK